MTHATGSAAPVCITCRERHDTEALLHVALEQNQSLRMEVQRLNAAVLMLEAHAAATAETP